MAAARKILVTGGNAGIGLAVCKQLVDHGCHVLLGARSLDRGTEALNAIRSSSVNAQIDLVHIDTGCDESVTQAVETVEGPIYAIVNNAGN